MEDNKNNRFKFLTKKPALVAIGFIVILLLSILVVSMSSDSSEDGFTLIKSTPLDGAMVKPEETTVSLEFSQEMPLIQEDNFRVIVSPSVEYVYGILGNTLNINLSDLRLVDGQQYTVTVFNLKSRSGEEIDSLSVSFSVDLQDSAAEFISNLPYTGDGFVVAGISESSLYVRISGTPYDDSEQMATNLLEGLGLTETKFDIDIDRPDQRPYQQEDRVIDDF